MGFALSFRPCAAMGCSISRTRLEPPPLSSSVFSCELNLTCPKLRVEPASNDDCTRFQRRLESSVRRMPTCQQNNHCRMSVAGIDALKCDARVTDASAQADDPFHNVRPSSFRNALPEKFRALRPARVDFSQFAGGAALPLCVSRPFFKIGADLCIRFRPTRFMRRRFSLLSSFDLSALLRAIIYLEPRIAAALRIAHSTTSHRL